MIRNNIIFYVAAIFFRGIGSFMSLKPFFWFKMHPKKSILPTIIRCSIVVVIYIVFEDLGRRFSGRSIGAGVWSENKPHLLNKLNYVPWDVKN